MGGKGSGYFGHSREHGLHRKGISTKIDEHRRFDVSKFVATGNPKLYDAHGEIMLDADGLRDILSKAKSDIAKAQIGEKIKGIGTKIKEKAKVGKDILGQKLEDRRNRKVIETKKRDEQEQSLGDTIKQVFKETPVSREALTDLPSASLTSKDADSIIKVSENKEKIIQYANTLNLDIKMLEVEGKKLKKRYHIDQRNTEAIDRNDMLFDKKKLNEQLKDLEVSGLEPDKEKNERNKLITTFKTKYAIRKAERDSYRERDKKTVEFVFELRNDMRKLHRQVNKRVQRMIASGVKVSGVKDYRVTERKPTGFGTERQGYRSPKTSLWYTWKIEGGS